MAYSVLRTLSRINVFSAVVFLIQFTVLSDRLWMEEARSFALLFISILFLLLHNSTFDTLWHSGLITAVLAWLVDLNPLGPSYMSHLAFNCFLLFVSCEDKGIYDL